VANFTAKELQRLRQATGAGMLDVKKALEETTVTTTPRCRTAAQGPGGRGQAGRS